MEKIIRLEGNREAQALVGLHDGNLKTIENEFKVKITLRVEFFKISGTSRNIKKTSNLIDYLLKLLRSGKNDLGNMGLHDLIRGFKEEKEGDLNIRPVNFSRLQGTKLVGPRTKGQKEYTEAIKKYDIVFGIGPAGTGKTYLAMASAVEALKKQEVRRIILTRPAIEAGESLGFLPGDMYEKISPYLRPLYDALYDMMEAETIDKYLETGIIEVAPLAYMRGRTLNDAFIVLDEAQNATAEQMKMFLTRLGFDSKAVITGDMTQSDLPNGKPIGLFQARDILKDI